MFNYLLIVIILALTACGGMPVESTEPAASVPKTSAIKSTAPVPKAAPMAVPKIAPAPMAAPMPVPKAAPLHAPIAASTVNGKAKLISVRDFLVRGETTSPGFAAYGYLVFSGRPSTDEEKARYAIICDAYLSKIESKAEYENMAHSMFATTYWPLSRQISPDNANCQTIIENYDYATAERIISISGIPQNRRGPFIVAWTIPYERADINTSPKLILDLSTLPDEDMYYAIKLWKENVAADPEAWAQGKMNVKVIISAFVDFMKRYSDEILRITSS